MDLLRRRLITTSLALAAAHPLLAALAQALASNGPQAEKTRMRTFNFPVEFPRADQLPVVCRIRSDPRFAAKALRDEFPRNTTARFLDRVVAAFGSPGFTYRAAEGNAIEIIAPDGAPALSDWQRAILLNLIDFGQDFESPASTTIAAVEFPMADRDVASVDALMSALRAENDVAVALLNGLMALYPAEDEDADSSWPEDYHDSYYYGIDLRFDKSMRADDIAGIEALLHALQDTGMWTGYEAHRTTEQVVDSGRTGISYEIEVEAQSIRYLVERPASDPALAVALLWKRAEQLLGAPVAGSWIRVMPED